MAGKSRVFFCTFSGHLRKSLIIRYNLVFSGVPKTFVWLSDKSWISQKMLVFKLSE